MKPNRSQFLRSVVISTVMATLLPTRPAMAQSSSDGCSFAGASRYTTNTSCTFEDFDKPNGYGGDLTVATCSGSNNDDAFGWFQANSTTMNITYDPNTNLDAILHVFSGACGSLTQIGCSNAGGNGVNETVVVATTVGTNYAFRVQRNGSNQAMDGRICVWGIPPPPANDDPCGAISLTVGTSCSPINGTNVSATATAGPPAPGCAAYSTADVWYSFTVTAGQSVNIETSAGTLTDGGVAIYGPAATCAGPFTLISCDDNNGPGNMGQAQAGSLAAGTYYARVWGNGGATGTFTICAHALANDNPCGAIPLTIGTSCSAINGTNVNATTTTGPPAPGCAAFSSADVWYSFVATAGQAINIETNVGTLTDGGVAIYGPAATCAGPFTLITCDDNNGPGNMGQAQAGGLAAGTYYVRVWGNGGATGTFTICAHALANDNPCGATALTVGATCSATNSTNVNATTTTGPPAPGCAAFSSADVWFSFVAPAGGAVNLETSAGTLTDGGMALYGPAATCAGPFTLIACDDNTGPGNMSFLSRTGLTVGATYYVRVWGNGGTTGTFGICVATPLVNDNPCGAVALPVNTSCVGTTGGNMTSTGTAGPPAPGCAAYSGADVWFSFVAPAVGAVNIETAAGTLTDGGMALYSAPNCAGAFTLISCGDNNGPSSMPLLQAASLTVGATYFVRVWGNSGTTGTFGICVYTPPTNDNPCTATALTVGSSCSSVNSTNYGALATAGPPVPGCAAYTGGDVWFSFVAPAIGSINLETTAGTLTDGGMALYSAPACGGAFTLIACDDNNGPGNMPLLQAASLTVGVTYYVRVWGNSGATGTFAICAYTPPANDNPCGATALAVGSTCSSVNSTNYGALATAGPPAPGCAAYTGGDVWFSFVAPAIGSINLETTAGTLTDGGLALYSAPACGGAFTLIACDDNNGPGNMPLLQAASLTVGTTYYVRVWGNSGATGTFAICAYTPPANDNPCNAVALTLGSFCTGTSGYNTGALPTTGVPAPGCAAYTGGDVWFSFVAGPTGVANIETTAGSMTDSGMELYSATACNGTFASIQCDNNSGPGSMSEIQRTGLTPGQTYYVRMWGNSGVTGTFDICVWAPTPPVNDNPCAATALTLGTTCSSTTYSNQNGTQTAGIPDPGCGNFTGSAIDVWYSFTAPVTGTVNFNVVAGTLTNASMALYAATACNGTFSLVECDDNDGPGNAPFLYHYDLVPGNTYYLRVWGNGGTTGTFDLCAVTPSTSGSCFYALLLNDSGGDGWGGSTIGVSVNGGAYTNYTLATGNRSVVYLPLNFGDIIALNYTAAGGFQGEISYMLQSGYGVLFSGGPTPATGLVYAHSNDCVPPDAPNDDCYGSLKVCSGSSVNANPANTGLKPDINLHTRGCLSNDERQGTWFNFTVSASGTMEFTVDPTNNADDYDFAVWGPESSVICPPTEAPYRCSYAANGGNTGLQLGAGDDSEGSGGNRVVNAMNVTVGESYVLYVSNWSQSGLSFDLTWNLTNGASIDCTVLPIELMRFQADALETSVALDWATASESGNSHFMVERSSDGEYFSTIGQVQGAGDSFSTREYGFTDPAPERGVNYYRLKQVDFDGGYTYSPVEAVSFGMSIAAGTPFPNPTAGSVNVNVELASDGLVELVVHDASGRSVQRVQHAVSAGQRVLSAPVTGLDPGTYVLTVKGPDGTLVNAGRFVAQ